VPYHQIKSGYAPAIVPAVRCTYPELLFWHKNLDYFQENIQENNEDKKVAQVGIETTHLHSQGGDVTHWLTGAPNRSLLF